MGCKHALMTCMDYRLHAREDGRNLIANFVRDLGEDCDMMARAGAIQDLIHCEGDHTHFNECLLRDTNVAANLHGVEVLHIIHHEDCGAYKHHNFPTPQAEIDHHIEDMICARNLILERYPDIKIKLYLAKLKEGSQDDYFIEGAEK